MLKQNEIVNEFKILTEYTKSIIKGYHNSFICLGKHGQGKTTTILNTLENEGANYVYHSGISTPKALFEFLYEHRDNKIIVFDDCAGLINNVYALSVLLSALWSVSDKRVIQWNSTRDNPKSAKVSCHSKYIFNSRIIVIANKLPSGYYSDVILSRCLVYNLNLSYKQIIKIMYLIGDKEVADYIKENTSSATKNFDLRLLRKAEKFKEYDKDKWRELIKPMLEVNEELNLIVQGLSCKDWTERVGKSRATYFNYKKSLKV